MNKTFGHSKYDYRNKNTNNSRNDHAGVYKKSSK